MDGGVLGSLFDPAFVASNPIHYAESAQECWDEVPSPTVPVLTAEEEDEIQGTCEGWVTYDAADLLPAAARGSGSSSFPLPQRGGQKEGPGSRTWPWLLVGLVLFALVGVAAVLLPSFAFAALLAAGAVVILWLLLPEALILALLVSRSSVDGFMDLFTLFSGSALSMNLSGAVNSLAVGWAF